MQRARRSNSRLGKNFLPHRRTDVFFVLLILAFSAFTRSSRIPEQSLPELSAVSGLILALYAMNFLPINLAGVFLILLLLHFSYSRRRLQVTECLALSAAVVSMFLGAILPGSFTAHSRRESA